MLRLLLANPAKGADEMVQASIAITLISMALFRVDLGVLTMIMIAPISPGPDDVRQDRWTATPMAGYRPRSNRYGDNSGRPHMITHCPVFFRGGVFAGGG